MKSERELLESFKLGKGKAEFEARASGKAIDLLFEKEDEIWVVEAKRKLNLEALGQIHVYKHLSRNEFTSSKLA